MTSTKVLDYFASLVADENGIPLTETALSIAQDAYPDLDLQGELAALDVLALRLKRRIAEGTPAIQRLRLLNHFFYRDLGFGANANDYYDPDNSYLNVVLRQRRGIPISLAVLHMELGQQIGLPLKGVSFPNHFLLRMTIPAGEVILDPLTGETLSKEQLQEMLDPYLEREGISDASQVPLGLFLRPASHREIIARMLRNLKAIYLQESRWQRLLAVQNRLVILLPGSIEEVRDRGLAYANLECFRPALADLEAYVKARPDAADIGQIRERMPALRMMSRSLS